MKTKIAVLGITVLVALGGFASTASASYIKGMTPNSYIKG